MDKQDELIDSLAKKYNDNLQKVNDRIEQMKEENRGLVHKVAGAIKGVINAIAHLKDLLFNVLSRVASVIGTIIAHPIRFLGNLVDAGTLGFNNFKDHIGEYLEKGFLQWLFGQAATTGIELPKSFDWAGILGLVMQLLGLTHANIRARAVKLLGEKAVAVLETTAEIFQLLISGGPGALWDYMKDMVSNALEAGIETIKSYVMEKVIMAGITWIIGLLNPVSAFIKACKAIYSIVMFFVEHGSEIVDLVNSVIDSMAAIAEGKISQAADFVEKSLARAIPVIIGFLASLLGVEGIGERIKSAVETVRNPVNQAVDWVISKAASAAKSVGGALGFGEKKGKEEKGAAGEEETPKWNIGVAGVTDDIEKMKANGLEEKAIHARFPEWKSTYGFSDLNVNVVDDDFVISGSMSPADKPITKASTGLHSGTEKDPIPIYWYKPDGAYRKSITLTDPVKGKMSVPMVSRTHITDQYLGSVNIGIYQANLITEGKVLKRTSGTDAMRGGKQASFASLLKRFGYDLREGMEEDADHVKDLGFGGEDEFSNLWPLDSETNQRGLKYANSYMVEYIQDRKVETKSVKSLDNKYFKIKGFRYPAEKLGGRD